MDEPQPLFHRILPGSGGIFQLTKPTLHLNLTSPMESMFFQESQHNFWLDEQYPKIDVRIAIGVKLDCLSTSIEGHEPMPPFETDRPYAL